MVNYYSFDGKTDRYSFTPIAIVQSPFKDKYGVPRQPQLAIAAQGTIKFRNDPDLVTALKTLEQFSHLWLIFVFHQHGGKNWKPSIRPPRLGGREKAGVLASRSPHRPNPLGMSVVKLDSMDLTAPGGAEIHISGLDILDGTPVIDIKPYIVYADSVPAAKSGWAEDEIKKYAISFTQEATQKIEKIDLIQNNFSKLLVQILEIDPRPAHQKREMPIEHPEAWGREFGIEILGYEVKYQLKEMGIQVLKIGAKDEF